MSSTDTSYNRNPLAVNPLITDESLYESSTVRAPRRIGVVACCKTKLSHAAPARDLYQSPLFKHARTYVERECDDWLILSALYGVCTPDRLISPYDVTLAAKSAEERRIWAALCWSELFLLSHAHENTIFVPLCGYLYRAALDGLRCEPPYSGLGIGQQLQFLIRANRAASEPESREVTP
jgi:hypothetical protein